MTVNIYNALELLMSLKIVYFIFTPVADAAAVVAAIAIFFISLCQIYHLLYLNTFKCNELSSPDIKNMVVKKKILRMSVLVLSHNFFSRSLLSISLVRAAIDQQRL